ncbi:hypothetical protein EJB05_32729, partial [Eragrostis curvula]
MAVRRESRTSSAASSASSSSPSSSSSSASESPSLPTNGGGELGELTALALGQALVVSVIATAGSHISGGHINPAVTLAFAVGGHITLFRSALYVAAQLLGSCTACVLLTYLFTATGGLAAAAHALPEGVVAEAVFTFTLLFVIYATILNPRKVAPGMGPMPTGLLVGANTIAGSTLSGASMNPARSFGPALVAGVWTNHWVYWAGPLLGGPFAALVYECVFMDDGSRQLLPQHK